ncbi:MAG: hypothetical protein R3272_09655 [Candidatus Promineifilaceae bacterium]|nr:hypothetical protein [Candidatus Promineifilaceae bacterium]
MDGLQKETRHMLELALIVAMAILVSLVALPPATTPVSYKFQVWAGDDDPDTFRIKIWDEYDGGTEFLFYDNGFDGSGYESGQPISGGSIVIHSK